MCLHARPVTCLAGKGVFVPGQQNRYLITGGGDGMTERHFSIHWVVLLMKYSGSISADEFNFRVRPGMLAILPPHTTVTLRFERKSVQYYAHLSLPSGREPGVLVPGIIWLGNHRKKVESLFEAGAAAFKRKRLDEANAIFQQLLETVAVLDAGKNIAEIRIPPKVRDTLKLIEDRLNEPVYIEDLAAATGLSRRHLLNLFQRFLGCSIVSYVQRRRIERALVLLNRTEMSIKAVAAEVGLSSLQTFNKLVRRVTGISPRAYRQRLREGYGIREHFNAKGPLTANKSISA